MALITCKECKKEISSEADACPHCGARADKKPGFATGCLLVVIGFVVFGAIAESCSNSADKAAKRAAEGSMTPAQRAAEDRAKADKEKVFQTVVGAGLAVKSSLRNPQSVEWGYIGANSDATVICIEYRAQNGFGGVNKEFTVFVKGVPSQRPQVWNKQCANKSLTDMTYARQALK